MSELEEDSFLNFHLLQIVKAKNLKFIGKRCFMNCYSLLTVDSPLEIVQEMAFKNCFSLENLQTEQIKEIHEESFSNCGLAEFINSYITEIPAKSFCNSALKVLKCVNVTKIQLNAIPEHTLVECPEFYLKEAK